MVNPQEIINYNRTDAELEELILFLICVAGKKASTVSGQLNQFLKPIEWRDYINGDNSSITPFSFIEITLFENTLIDRLEREKFGCYTRIERAFTELVEAKLDLRTCTKEQLMAIHGIGRKSASCFLAWTREGGTGCNA